MKPAPEDATSTSDRSVRVAPLTHSAIAVVASVALTVVGMMLVIGGVLVPGVFLTGAVLIGISLIGYAVAGVLEVRAAQ